ncbi:MAG: hypothetical protein JWM28_2742 [Chitinophagaceae bacterium]|nr:hypothetical protein [Chitinophagaceae bacterium]
MNKSNKDKSSGGRGMLIPRLRDFKIQREHHWTDHQYIKAAEALNTFTDLMDKVEFIYNHSGASGLFGFINRTIDGSSVRYGLNAKDYTTSQSIGWYYIVHENEVLLKEIVNNFSIKYALCDEDEKEIFINDNLEYIEKEVRKNYSETDQQYFRSNPFAYGYLSERRKDNSWSFIGMDKNSFTFPFCFEVARGAAYYKFQRYLIHALTLLKDSPVTKTATAFSDEKPTVGAIAIAHVFWGKVDDTKKITKTNVASLSTQYGISRNTLLKEFLFYSNQQNLLDLPEDKKESKKTVQPFVKRLIQASEFIKDKSPKAFRELSELSNSMKLRFQNYLQ